MTSNHLAAVLLVAIAAPVAWRLGGAHAGGVAVGALLGGGLSFACGAWHARLLAVAPRHVMHAVVVGMLLKLFVLLAVVLLLRFVWPLGASCYWQSFLLSFSTIPRLLDVAPRSVYTNPLLQAISSPVNFPFPTFFPPLPHPIPYP